VGAVARYIGNIAYTAHELVDPQHLILDTLESIAYAFEHVHNPNRHVSKREDMVTNGILSLPPHLSRLSILTDSAICNSSAERQTFIQTTGLPPELFHSYCVFDVTYGTYRVFIEANLSGDVDS